MPLRRKKYAGGSGKDLEMVNIGAAETGIRTEVIEEIRNIARRCGTERVILFGSRARGDFKRTSDIDLAVCGGDFTCFAIDVEEETSTLLEFDFVDMSRDVQKELLEIIQKEGLVLYEKI